MSVWAWVVKEKKRKNEKRMTCWNAYILDFGIYHNLDELEFDLFGERKKERYGSVWYLFPRRMLWYISSSR
jgi:hypothetical protein